LFADDISLYLIVDEAADQLNKDIESIHHWSQKWLIKFNSDKTEIITISNNITTIVYMDNVIIKKVEADKQLELSISEDGIFE